MPRIYDYSLSSRNPVGVEYILEEKARGQPLGSLWRRWSIESQRGVVTQLVDLEAKLASILFQKHGCIYYKADLVAKGDPAQSLEVANNGGSTELNLALLDKFAIGPLTQAILWEGERATMSLDRGPCKLGLLSEMCV